MLLKGAGLKVLRWVVWGLFALIFVRGAASFIGAPQSTNGQAAQAPALPPPEPAGLRALPPMFAWEYLTFQPGQPDERSSRLQPFLARDLDSQAGWSIGKEGAGQNVKGAWVHSLKEVDSAHWNVTVAVRVAPFQDVTETDAAGARRTARRALPEKTVYLSVPVSVVQTGGLVVSDYPALVPTPIGGDATPAASGQEVTDRGDRVKALAAGFFRSYLTGSADVSYYLEPNVNLPALRAEMIFDAVPRVTLVDTGSGIRATADVAVTDPVTGARFTYRYTMLLVERENRWYIKDLLQKGE